MIFAIPTPFGHFGNMWCIIENSWIDFFLEKLKAWDLFSTFSVIILVFSPPLSSNTINNPPSALRDLFHLHDNHTFQALQKIWKIVKFFNVSFLGLPQHKSQTLQIWTWKLKTIRKIRNSNGLGPSPPVLGGLCITVDSVPRPLTRKHRQHCVEVALGGKQVHLGFRLSVLSSSCN